MGIWSIAPSLALGRLLELRMPSSHLENAASFAALRSLKENRGRTRGVLVVFGFVACCICGALVARRALSRTRSALARPLSALASAEPDDPVAQARARLEQFEAQRRRATDFAQLAPANLTHGADPYALARLDAAHLVGVLRGASALVVLDNQLHELDRAQVPDSAITVAVTARDECWVGGETSPWLVRYRLAGRHLTRIGTEGCREFSAFAR